MLGWLLQAAVALSGYPPIPVEELPPVTALSAAAMAAEVCPDAPGQCGSLAAVFDTEHYRILVRDDLDVENATHNSFLVHEFVHVLQWHARGDAIYATCDQSRSTELEAYGAQNGYLKREGQFARFGAELAFVNCDGPQATLYLPGLVNR